MKFLTACAGLLLLSGSVPEREVCPQRRLVGPNMARFCKEVGPEPVKKVTRKQSRILQKVGPTMSLLEAWQRGLRQ
jgi:hypothetical protein